LDERPDTVTIPTVISPATITDRSFIALNLFLDFIFGLAFF
jgi:hypothetical protein